MNALTVEERDLLPWIFGAVLAACAAFAIAVGTNHRIASPELPMASQAVTVTAAPTTTLPPTVPAPVAQPAPAAAAAPIEAPTSALPPGQVWECRINGQRTFSNSPCGANASIRQLNTLNTMQASPLLAPMPTYEPGPLYGPAYEDSPPSSDNRTFIALGRNAFYDRPRHDRHPPRHDGGRVKPH
jgi:hypothetical protein